MKVENLAAVENSKLYTEQVKLLYLNAPVGMIATIINASILTFIQWNVIAKPILLTWLSSLIIITIIRFHHYLQYRRTPFAAERARYWGNWFIGGIAISGVAWGLAGIFLFAPDSIAHQIFPAFVLGGMVAGATSAFIALKMAFFAYSVPALVPIIIKLFLITDPIHLAMGGMTALFFILMVITAFRNHQMTTTSLLLRFENQNLIQYLSEAKNRVDNINKQLEAEIIERKNAEKELKRHQEQLEAMVAERTTELSAANTELRQEIEERKQIAQALKESEEKYRLLVENANDGILIAQDRVIKFANPTATQLSGYSAAELAEIPFLNLIHPDDQEMVRDRYSRRIKGDPVISNYSFRIISKKNEVLWVDLNAVLIKWEGKPAILNFMRDITHNKKLEAQLQLAQKMESIGTLAGGIAHDFNNLLMGIQGNISLILQELAPDHPDYEKFKQIEEYAQSGAELTKQLLGLARGGKYEIKTTDLNEIIKTSAAMFGRTRKEIAIHTNLQSDLWTVNVDQGQIKQVLLNLYINAWQAMSGGGDLYLTSQNIVLDADSLKSNHLKPGRYAKISITDTGVGIDKDTQQRIFDPFFTTKEIGRGTGLGLASAYGIIKNHDGLITIYSEKGFGATFNIYLPASDKKIMPEKAIQPSLLKSTETILLVDDEDMIIDVGQKMMRKMGFEVLIARSGPEAISIYQDNVSQIDLVILDMILPGMCGAEIFSAIKKINPAVKVLLSSGYSQNGQASAIIKTGAAGFIQKPFGLNELSQKLRDLLGKA